MGVSAEEPFGADTAIDWAVEFECAAQERLIEVTPVGYGASLGNTVSRTGGI